MIIRIILLFAIVAILVWLLKRLFAGTPDPKEIGHNNPAQAENMRQCKYCGTHIPESLVISQQDNPYCCQDHADRDQH